MTPDPRWHKRGPLVVLLVPEHPKSPPLHCGHGHHELRTAEGCMAKWARQLYGRAEGQVLEHFRIAEPRDFGEIV